MRVLTQLWNALCDFFLQRDSEYWAPIFIAEGARLASAGPLIGAAGRRRRRRRAEARVGAPLRAGLCACVCYYMCVVLTSAKGERGDDEIAQPRRAAAPRSAPARSAPPVDR